MRRGGLQVWIRSVWILAPSVAALSPSLRTSLCHRSYLTCLCYCPLSQRKGTITLLRWLEGRANENTI